MLGPSHALGIVTFTVLAGCAETPPADTVPPATEENPPATPRVPAEVPVAVFGPTTEGEIAELNLASAVQAIRGRVERRPFDQAARSRLVDLLLLEASQLGRFSRFDELDARTAGTLADFPDAPRSWTERAAFLSAVHRFEEAESHLQQALERGAAEADVERQRITITLATEGASESILARVDAISDSSFQGLTLRAPVLAGLGRFQEADDAYVAALAAYRDVSPFPVAWVAFQRGVMWAEAADRPDLAVPLYRDAVARLPGYVVATVHLAELEGASGATETATARLEARVDDRAEDPEPYGLLAELVAANDPDRSAELTQTAREMYDSLLERHRAAFLDHGSEFFTGPGADPARALRMALENVEARPIPRSYLVAMEAAIAAEDRTALCSLAEAARPLAPVHPVLEAALEEHDAACR